MFIIYGIFILLAVFLFYMVFIEPRLLRKKHYFIRKNKTKILDISHAYDLYQINTNIVVAHISDTHFSGRYKPGRINAVIRSINKTKPDLIVFTGDLMDNYQTWPTKYTKRLVAKLSKLSAPMGKVAVLGNHDYKGDGQYFVSEVLREADFMLLKNEVLFGSNDKISINIAGIDDVLKGQPQFHYERTLAQWNLLLVHEPDSVQMIQQRKQYDLILSGHSHGEQIRLPFLKLKHAGAIKYTSGIYMLSPDTLLSVTNGLGTTILPMRFGAPPEIIYYHLAKEIQAV